MDGFFLPNATSKQPDSIIPKCGACGLYKQCESPKMPIHGNGEKSILIVGSAPSYDDDLATSHFMDDAGDLLRASLDRSGINLDRDCWQTNALICFTKTPTSDQVEHCRANLTNAIKELNPKTILLLGEHAVKSLLGPVWKEGVGSITKWIGWNIPLQKYNAWVCPTLNPREILDSQGDAEGPVKKLWFNRHIEALSSLSGRPWHVIPDYTNEVQLIYNPEIVARTLKEIQNSGKAFAWDLETNCLKPDSDKAEIVCCSVSTGDETYAYPWIGAAVQATKELLLADNKKIGANCKFESRWVKTKLGIDVKNWVWDCMLSAHVLDNRSAITSVKFQSLVKLGFPDWSADIKPYLETTDKNGLNKIREIDTKTLLTYCGIDSRVEYELAKVQRKEINNGATG